MRNILKKTWAVIKYNMGSLLLFETGYRLSLIHIFTVLYATADITSGYVKNIAGQVRNRGNLILAKAVALFLYTVLTMLLFTGIQTFSNAIFYEKLVMGPGKEFFQYAVLQTLLHFALVMVIMCLAVVLRNNVIKMCIRDRAER